MKRDKLLIIIVYSFVLLFVYTALSKLFAYPIYLYDLRRSPELGAFAVPISIIIPGSELIAAGMLLTNKWRRTGFWMTTILMALFTLYVCYVITFAAEQPCTCGGIIRELSWPQHLAFNIAFTALAVLGLRMNSGNQSIKPSISPRAAF